MLYLQNGDRIVTIESVTSLHPMYDVTPSLKFTAAEAAAAVAYAGTAVVQVLATRWHHGRSLADCVINLSFITGAVARRRDRTFPLPPPPSQLVFTVIPGVSNTRPAKLFCAARGHVHELKNILGKNRLYYPFH